MDLAGWIVLGVLFVVALLLIVGELLIVSPKTRTRGPVARPDDKQIFTTMKSARRP